MRERFLDWTFSDHFNELGGLYQLAMRKHLDLSLRTSIYRFSTHWLSGRKEKFILTRTEKQTPPPKLNITLEISWLFLWQFVKSHVHFPFNQKVGLEYSATSRSKKNSIFQNFQKRGLPCEVYPNFPIFFFPGSSLKILLAPPGMSRIFGCWMVWFWDKY